MKRFAVVTLAAVGALVAGPAAFADHGLPHLPDVSVPSALPSAAPVTQISGQLERVLRDAGELVKEISGTPRTGAPEDPKQKPAGGKIEPPVVAPDGSVPNVGRPGPGTEPEGVQIGTTNNWPAASDVTRSSAPSTLGGSLSLLGANAAALARPMGLPLALALIVVGIILLATRRPSAIKLGSERTWGRERSTWRL